MSADDSGLTRKEDFGGLGLERNGRGGYPDAPFRSDHQNAGDSQLEKGGATSRIQCETQLETTPRLIPGVGRGTCGVHDEEEEGEPECKRDSNGRAFDTETTVVHKVDVERDIDGGDGDKHVGGCVHDP
jgi:hypothetical protein